jgi:cytochrome oxidase Cu insertion factor (SCO1/SenC/PrrC family)
MMLPVGTVRDRQHDAPSDQLQPRTEPSAGWPVNRVIVVALSVALVTAFAAAFVLRGRNELVGQQSPVAGRDLPAAISHSLAYTMGLSKLPGRPAPSFTLVDQHGRSMSTADLKGHPVVLEFIDPHCTDICPIMSQELITAYHALGSAASKVIFLAVNVNPWHTDVASMATYSDAHGLKTLPTWHFLTGPPSRLRAVWQSYHVSVSAPDPATDVVHTSVVYFIDTHGRERYIAFPTADHTSSGEAFLPATATAAWGKGIALVATSLTGK